MNSDQFLATMAELMQRDEPLTLTDKLEDIDEWDSMSMMVIIAYFDTKLHISITFDQLASAKTMQDIQKLALVS